MRKKEMTKSGENNEFLRSIMDSLNYYREEKCAVHIVLRNRRFYNGEIVELREAIIVLNDKKIGKISVPIREIYLVESFHDPGGKKKNG